MVPTLKKPSAPPAANPLTLIQYETTEALFRNVMVPSVLRKRIQPRQTPLELLDLLLIDKELSFAITVLAEALPGREALLWCALAIEEVLGDTMPRPERGLFEACVRPVMNRVDPLPKLGAPVDEAFQETAVHAFYEAVRASGPLLETKPGQKPPETRGGPIPRLVNQAIDRLTYAGSIDEIEPRRETIIALGIGLARGLYRFAK